MNTPMVHGKMIRHVSFVTAQVQPAGAQGARVSPGSGRVGVEPLACAVVILAPYQHVHSCLPLDYLPQSHQHQ